MKDVLKRLLWEIEKRGNRITTYDLNKIGSMQYQRDLGELRVEVAKRGWTLTYKEPIEGQRRNNMYRLIKPGQPLQILLSY